MNYSDLQEPNMNPFVCNVSVYREDTHVGRVAYHPQHLSLFERACKTDSFKPNRMPEWIRAEINNAK